MAESIFFLGDAVRDEFDQLQDRPVLREVKDCVVSPAGDQVVRGDGYVHGDVSKFQILAPPGTVFREGDVIRVRGEEFRVDPLKGFDYSVGRRPALPRHKPRVSVIVSRGEVSDGIS